MFAAAIILLNLENAYLFIKYPVFQGFWRPYVDEKQQNKKQMVLHMCLVIYV